MQIRYLLLRLRRHLPTAHLALWQQLQLLIWSSLLIGTPAWSLPTTTISQSAASLQPAQPTNPFERSSQASTTPVSWLPRQLKEFLIESCTADSREWVHAPYCAGSEASQVESKRIARTFQPNQSVTFTQDLATQSHQAAALDSREQQSVAALKFGFEGVFSRDVQTEFAQSPFNSAPSASDPELGTLRLQQSHDRSHSAKPSGSLQASACDPELGCIRIDNPAREKPSLPNSVCDPELGCIRIDNPATREQSPTPVAACDPELGCIRIDNPAAREQSPTPVAACDVELGCIRIQEPLPTPPAPVRAPVVYLLARFDYFRSNNIFLAPAPIEDGLIRPGLTLFAAPSLGPDTFLVLSIDGSLIRYSNQSQINYDEIRLRAGVLQRLSPTMFGEIGWSNQQLFISGDKLPGLPAGTRFLNDHGIRFELSRRDQLSPRLILNTFYQFRYSLADPDDRSRVINALIASLSYDIQPTLQAAIDYQYALANFTRQNREDHYHQAIARLTYTAFRNTQFNVFAGYSFGRSSDRTVDFNGFIFGVGVTWTLGLF